MSDACLKNEPKIAIAWNLKGSRIEVAIIERKQETKKKKVFTSFATTLQETTLLLQLTIDGLLNRVTTFA